MLRVECVVPGLRRWHPTSRWCRAPIKYPPISQAARSLNRRPSATSWPSSVDGATAARSKTSTCCASAATTSSTSMASKFLRSDDRAGFHQDFEPEAEATGVELLVEPRADGTPQVEIEDTRPVGQVSPAPRARRNPRVHNSESPDVGTSGDSRGTTCARCGVSRMRSSRRRVSRAGRCTEVPPRRRTR